MSEQKDQLLHEIQNMFGRARRAYLTKLLEWPSVDGGLFNPPSPASGNIGAEGGPNQLRDLERMVNEVMPLPPNPVTFKRCQLACAYLAVAVRGILPSNVVGTSASGCGDEDDSGDEAVGDDGNLERVEEDLHGASLSAFPITGAGKRRLQVRLCTAWVVARELETVAQFF